MRGADQVAQVLGAAGVEIVFVMSGNQVMVAFDALLDTQIRVLHVRHEAAAVHMADAWAQLTGKVGIALVPAGPGFANALSALYSSRMAESSILLLSGHAPVSHLGMGAFQEMPQAEVASHFAKESWMVKSARDVAPTIARAISAARSGRPGPVHVALPLDILCAEATGGAAPPLGPIAGPRSGLDDEAGRRALDAMAAAARPMILGGPTLARSSGASAAARLEAATGVPVICSESPRGTSDPSLGAFAEVLKEADLILSVGRKLDFTVQHGTAMADDCIIIHIDPDEHELGRSTRLFGNRLMLAERADAIPAAERLIALANGVTEADDGWAEAVKAAIAHRPAEWDTLSGDPNGPLHPVELCRIVQAKLTELPDAVLVIDGGEFGQWAQACLHAPNRIINGPSGAIGAGLPFSVAAGLARPDAPVIALVGDGSTGFHVSEFDTAARADSRFVVIVGNDARWNAEFQIQVRDFGPQRAIGCELNATRYDRVALALGCYGAHVDRPAALAPALDAALSSGKAACLNVAIESHPAPTLRHA